VNDFINECAAFPNGGYDGQVNAMTKAVAALAQGGPAGDGLVCPGLSERLPDQPDLR
jgi:hypothetical protein